MTITLGKTEINTVDKVSIAASSIRDKVGRFDITMDQMAGMHEFDSFKHLVRNHENRLERESTPAFVKLILEGWTKKVHYHKIVGILCSKIVDFGKARCILKLTVMFNYNDNIQLKVDCRDKIENE